MNRNNKTSSITEAAMITGIMVILALISSFIMVTTLIYPIPAIILAKRKGIKYSALAVLAADIIISIMLGASTGFFYFVLYSPFALALAYGIYRNESANKSIMYGAAAYMVSFVILVLGMDAFMGINFVDDLRNMSMEQIRIVEQMTNSMSSLMDPEKMQEGLNSLNMYKESMMFFINNLLPVAVISAAIVSSYINYVIAEKFANRFSININPRVRLSHFSFPRFFMIAMAGLLLISYLLALLKFNVGVIQLNLFTLVYFAMVIQGFATIKFFVEKSRLVRPTKVLVMFMVIYFALSFPGALMLIVFAGLVDLSIDLRKLNRAV